jgi:hypothetical protein
MHVTPQGRNSVTHLLKILNDSKYDSLLRLDLVPPATTTTLAASTSTVLDSASKSSSPCTVMDEC